MKYGIVLVILGALTVGLCIIKVESSPVDALQSGPNPGQSGPSADPAPVAAAAADDEDDLLLGLIGGNRG